MSDLTNEPDSSPTPMAFPPSPSPLWSPKRWLIALLLLALGWGLYTLGTMEDERNDGLPVVTNSLGELVQTSTPFVSPTVSVSASASQAPTVTTPDRTVLAAGGFKLTSKTSYSCSAQAPDDWSLMSTAQSNTADLYAPDKTMYAGYVIQGINTAAAGYMSYYSAPLNDADLYSSDPATVALAYGRIIVGSLGGTSDLTYTAETNETLGDYLLRSVASSTHKGVIFYHAAGFPGDGYTYSYIEPMYFAFTTGALWPSEGLLVAQIAGSIKCSTQFQPRDQYVVTARTSKSGDRSDSNGADAGYNPQLGTEYVHDPGTGENYLVSPSTNWSNNGPQGGGYYAEKSGGNDYVKLEPGRSD